MANVRHKPPLDTRVVEDFKKDDLTCAICLGILSNPKQCKNGHLFCEECISRSIQKNPRCPQCRCNLSEAELSRSLFVEKHLRAMMVYCSYHFQWDEAEKLWIVDERGCNETFEAQDVEKHELQCGYIPCSCPFSKICGKLRTKDLEDHKSKCDFRPIECQFCRLSIQAVKLKEHQEVCTFVTVSCHLCQQEVRRGELMFHLQQDCPENLVVCAYGCKEKVVRKGLRKHTEAKLDEHLEFLRTSLHKIQSMEASLQNEIRRRDKEIRYLMKRVKYDLKTIWVIDTWTKVLDIGYTQSQKFRLYGNEWYLGLYPNGDKETTKSFVSVYLFMVEPKQEGEGSPDLTVDKLKTKLDVNFRITFLNHKNTQNNIRLYFSASFPIEGVGSGWGSEKACSSSTLTKQNGYLHEDRLHVECEILSREKIIYV